MNSQISFWDGNHPFKITNRIRLIELFAGIGAQAKALERLRDEGLCDFEHWKICEFDKWAVASYNAIHQTDFKTSDITKIHGSDLEIVDTDSFTYLLTYSFPCTDLSLAGRQEGMAKGSGTRSGLLWEVERLLNECEELPQVLLMENVPQVICPDFFLWIEFLESKGYKNYYQNMNARDYGIPQNRNRTFMVSLLGDYYYEFPEPIPLKKRLKDVLEDKVDEKYYLSDKIIEFFEKNSNKQKENGNGFNFSPVERENAEVAKAITTRNGSRMDDNFLYDRAKPNRLFNIYGEDMGGGFAGNVWDKNQISPTLMTMDGGNREPLILDSEPINPMPDGTCRTIKSQYQQSSKANFESESTFGATRVKSGLRIRKLTPKECWRLMDFDDEDFERARKVNSDRQLYKQAGNSIVVKVIERLIREML